jgi:endothelin-converting enzyme/putative endopeptidase
MRLLILVTLTSLLTVALFAQQPSAPAAKISGFDARALDRTADPCADFYQFACGAWMANNPVPHDQTRWGRFNELQEHNREVLHQILEGLRTPPPSVSAVERKVGDYYASCMDEPAINALGRKPIQPELDRVATVKDRTTLIDTIAGLNRQGVRALWSFGSGPDLHDATMTIAHVDQGGLSLPDRDYYLKTDAKSVEIRAKYQVHVQKMFELLGDKPEVAAAEAQTVLSLEAELAKASLDRVSRRDPKKRDHKMSVADLQALAPNFEFPRYFAAASAPKFDTLNVEVPDYFKTINGALATIPLADWKTYLRWRIVDSAAPMLSKNFVDEDFNFWRQYLAGQKEIQARWKRCVAYTDLSLGEALGQLYVERVFPPESKRQMLNLVGGIDQAMGKDIQTVSWMSDSTKQAAQAKLAKVVNNIGYPDKWRDYTNLNVMRGDALGNLRRGAAFENQRQIDKVGKPVDRKEWEMTPPTVNAYYRASENDINFPAGILQPPFFDPAMDDAVNFGGIGAVIGHELTHGFDDQGAKYDAVGNLRDWWTDQDIAEFEKRGQCLADEYSSFVPVADVHLNGRLTLGENTADNGGVRLSYMALQDRLKAHPAASKIDGFTPEQRFFLAFAQIWCQNITPESARMLATTDPHSPGRFRTNGVLVNMPEFQSAFSCKAGQAMVSQKACRTW